MTVATMQTLSIIVPAFNEAGNINGTLDNVTSALASLPIDAEILVIDDGSTDTTAALVRDYSARCPQVRLLVNERNLGFGATYRRGVEAASRDHIVMVHGDNAWSAATLRPFFSRVGDADIIIGYTRDMWGSRPLVRTILSKTFTWIINRITGKGLHYYNGLQIHDADTLKGLRNESSGYGFQAEVLVKALQRSSSFVEVPMALTERAHGESKAFRMKNVVDVLRTVKRLWDLESRPAPQGPARART